MIQSGNLWPSLNLRENLSPADSDSIPLKIPARLINILFQLIS